MMKAVCSTCVWVGVACGWAHTMDCVVWCNAIARNAASDRERKPGRIAADRRAVDKECTCKGIHKRLYKLDANRMPGAYGCKEKQGLKGM